ncbi:FtsK/SpoIIIE domain-containing protein [Schlesneria paludicola]|uniref:FtsK/SpoIIIE domain-containing protein n=1 Tax=Schlesneria paludicola TaxID=360056 RepID=UPI0002E03DC2|nr:FtsK/SpoIIIE domain-containing protein [Schlesneria paludicola]
MSHELTVAHEQELLQRLLEQIKERAAKEHTIESEYATETQAEQAQYQSVFQLLTDNYETERTQLDQQRIDDLAECDRRCQVASAEVQHEYQRVLSEAEDRFQSENDAATKERDDAVWLVSSLLDDDSAGSPLQRLQQTQASHDAAEVELTAGLDSLDAGYVQVVRFLQRSHAWSEPAELSSNIDMTSVESLKAACLAAISAAEPLRQRILGRLLPKLFIGFIPVLVFLAIGGVLFGLVWGLLDPSLLTLKLKTTDPEWLYLASGVSAAFALLPMLFLHLMANQQVTGDYEQLVQHRTDARHAYLRWERMSKTELNMLEAECSHLQELRVKRRESAISGAESKWQSRTDASQQIYERTTQQAQSAYPTRLNFLETRRGQEREQIEEQYQAASDAFLFRREDDFRVLQSEFDTRMQQSRQRYQQAWTGLIREWQSTLADLARESDALCQMANAICPEWAEIASDRVADPKTSPAALSLGRIEVDLEQLDQGISHDPRLQTNRQQFPLPILLPLHDRPSLVLRASGEGRKVAVGALQSTMLRFLTSLPAGKVRFTIFDPVGLGANFSAFMHLADFDELLVTSRIWTEPSHIEKRLADLTEHMETVLQTYLRNEFATIDEYNEYAGEVAEPYRVLVVANFPANFTDVALRRLLSIADGGQRCGVYLLLSFDQSQELPRNFVAADLEKYATVLNWTDRGFRLADKPLTNWPLLLDAPPAPEQFGQIVRLAGQHSRDVRRVEVPFERVAPNEDQFWTSDSRSGIDVPIGRAGATKLQNLRLGKGTSQHVLVAGKTGSGKSTLLHALITNLSLYYSPTEVQFYLIDFKKGVEFKVYAEQRLPHARVIAIESDREFGVSVLERLDTLLKDRGELFREAGVQDIAGYRNARPDAIMPRTLLLVDEFQEFFIEDDALSQQASLLLDRLIRQGRAFGVHILLGSQTLAGAYSLARSTLGQVAVRIALQCSDTDAHLILSEENTAARLLTRPGEAIYNDANGLIEGNHPFQIVWLGEDDRQGYLQLAREEAEGTGQHERGTPAIREISLTPPLVFEGNIAADPAENNRLRRTLTKAWPEPARDSIAPIELPWTCWLGDSVSMSGPIELKFGLREGGNLLVVGRNEHAALGVISTASLAIAAQAKTSGIVTPTVYVLDGSIPNSQSANVWKQVESVSPAAASGHENGSNSVDRPLKVIPLRETAATLEALIAELHRRADEPGAPIVLVIYDLARFRDLRKSDDEYSYGGGFGSGEPKAASPAQNFTEILRDGPSAGIFTIAWVDSFQTSQRWLSREQMNRFELRVLFAMNANDSSSLVDSPLAGRLGENRALLYRGDLGTLEKFRPYSPPTADWLARLATPSELLPQLTSPPTLAGSAGQESTESEIATPPEATTDSTEEVGDSEISYDLPNIDEMNVQ